MGEGLADKLARRAEAVFAHHPSWQRRFKSARGREFILMSMRHWLAGVLARERPALFRALPESYKIGLELPDRMDFPLRPSPGSAILSRSRGRGKPGAHGVTRPIFGSRGRSPHRVTATPARCKILKPLPACFGFGSVAPITTRLIPAAMMASVQGGVRPCVLHGSSVT